VILSTVLNFCIFYKKYLVIFYKMSIEKRKNMCYNKITKEVQSNEKLNFIFQSFDDGGNIKREKSRKKSSKSPKSIF